MPAQQVDYDPALPDDRERLSNQSNPYRRRGSYAVDVPRQGHSRWGLSNLFATDRDTYVVQGWRVPGRQASVEIPEKLLRYLERDTQLAAVLHATERDSWILSGVVVTDAEALAQMHMPDHETCVEVGKVMLMQPVQGEAFDDLFRTFGRTAFHLELKDSYHTPHEAGPFDLFMKGQPDNFAWHQPWLRLVREATEAGKSITRVRVVTVPHSDYARWGLSIAPLNIDVGEDIRWLPRHLAGGIDFPDDDYWLFDDNRVVFTIFKDDGRFASGMETLDSELIEQCCKVYEQVWALAIPHAEYASM